MSVESSSADGAVEAMDSAVEGMSVFPFIPEASGSVCTLFTDSEISEAVDWQVGAKLTAGVLAELASSLLNELEEGAAGLEVAWVAGWMVVGVAVRPLMACAYENVEGPDIASVEDWNVATCKAVVLGVVCNNRKMLRT